MAFVKLDCSMLHSSIWPDKAARDIFITSLLMAEPFELTKETDQISALSLEVTGWKIPPGWYGFVRAAGTGIVHMAGIEREAGLQALSRLSSPESESRSPAHDGRRMARIEGGFLILNFFSYRDRDYSAADRMRRLRERRKMQKELRVTSDEESEKLRNVTQAEDRGRVQSTELNTNTPAAPAESEKPKPDPKYPPGLERFWNALPAPAKTRSSRKQCAVEWRKQKLEPRVDEVMRSLAAWCVSEDWRKESGNFIPGAHRWLNAEKWREPPGGQSGTAHAEPPRRKGGVTFINS